MMTSPTKRTGGYEISVVCLTQEDFKKAFPGFQPFWETEYSNPIPSLEKCFNEDYGMTTFSTAEYSKLLFNYSFEYAAKYVTEMPPSLENKFVLIKTDAQKLVLVFGDKGSFPNHANLAETYTRCVPGLENLNVISKEQTGKINKEGGKLPYNVLGGGVVKVPEFTQNGMQRSFWKNFRVSVKYSIDASVAYGSPLDYEEIGKEWEELAEQFGDCVNKFYADQAEICRKEACSLLAKIGRSEPLQQPEPVPKDLNP